MAHGAGRAGRAGDGKPIIDLYARLSYAVDGSTVNVDEQEEIGREDIARRGGTVGTIFKNDNSKSAWNPKVIRPDWLTLMKRLESGASDGVWILDLTRFTRKPIEGERLIEVAQSGTVVWSQSQEYNLLTADGRAAFRDAMNKAAHESDKIAERTRRGKRRKARRGVWPFGSRGFAVPRWEPNPPGWERGDPRTRVPGHVIDAERKTVREMYDRLLAGSVNVSALAVELNERGIRTVHGKNWTRSALADMLTRPVLAGLIVIDGETVGVRKNFDPVVTQDEWKSMCAKLAARRPGRPVGRVHVLSGLMTCGGCGHKMYGSNRSTRAEYRCRQEPGVRSNACGGNYIDSPTALRFVGEAVKERLADPRRAQAIADLLATVNKERAELMKERKHWEGEADKLAAKTATWGVDRVDKSMAPILEKIADIDKKIASLGDPGRTFVPADVAAREWDIAEARGDVDAMRLMVSVALPRLAMRVPLRRGDHSLERFDFDGTGGGAPLVPSMADAILASIPVFPGSTTIRELSAAMGIDASSMSRRLAKLTKEEVIIRERGKDHNNVQVIHFSRKPSDGS